MKEDEKMINKERLLKNFLEYIAIDSESGNEAAMAARVSADLKALGCDVRIDEAGSVIALFAGEAPALLMSAHIDTVTPGKGIRPIITDGVIHTDGSTILGGDDKSGVAAIIEAVASARVTAQCFGYGHAIGHAASIAVRDRLAPREIAGRDLREILNREGARLD